MTTATASAALTSNTQRTKSPITPTPSGLRRLAGAALLAAALAATPLAGSLGPQRADADQTIVTYTASGSWHAAIHTLPITTPAGATVRLPLHLYVPGAENLDAARYAEISHTVRPGARGGTDVDVTVRVRPTAVASFPTNGAVRGRDVPDGEGLFVQRGGSSDRPLVFSFHLARA